MSDDSGGKPILKIEVDDSQFDAFLDKYKQYGEAVKTAPAAWKDTETAVKSVSTGFEDAYNEFEKLNSLVVGPQFGKALSGFSQIGISSVKSWVSIRKEIEASAKGMSTLGRYALQFGAFGGIAMAAGAGVAGIALGAVPGVAKSLSDENRQNHELGLTPGESQAFNDQYGTTLGASTADLGKIADIKANPAEWSKLINATHGGVGVQDIEHLDPIDLWAKAAQKAGETYKSMGANAGVWAQASGANDLFGAGAVRNASTRDPDWWNQQHQQYTDEKAKLYVDPKTMDNNTQFEQKWQADLSVLKRDFELAIQPLEPLLIKGATAMTGFVGALARSQELKDDLDEMVSGLEDVNKFLHFASEQNAKPENHPDAAAADKVHSFGVTVWHGLEKSRDQIKNTLFGTPIPTYPGMVDDQYGDVDPTQQPKGKPSGVSESQFKHDPDRLAHMAEADKRYGMPTGYLEAHEYIESRNGTHNIGKDGKYLGAFQFDDPTAKQYQVDRFDEQSSINGAARKLSDLFNHYHDWAKASASFDGFAGLDADIAKYGDAWKDHISEFQKSTETSDYLRTMAARGVDFGKGSVKDQMAALPASRGDRDDDGASGGGNSSRNDSPRSPMPFHFVMPTTNINVMVPAGSNVFSSTAAMVQ